MGSLNEHSPGCRGGLKVSPSRPVFSAQPLGLSRLEVGTIAYSYGRHMTWRCECGGVSQPIETVDPRGDRRLSDLPWWTVAACSTAHGYADRRLHSRVQAKSTDWTHHNK